jgi:oligopeptide transport system substrate-binding protein
MSRFKKSLQISLLALLIIGLALTSSGCFLWDESQSISIPQEDTLILFNTGPLTLDPAISQELSSQIYIANIFSGLVAFDEELNLVPDIAERWEVDGEGMTYTFYLRQGVRFHNGKEVTARDFKYSWERACRLETDSATAATYLGDIVGVDRMLTGEAEEIEGVVVIDDYTLQVSIDAPKAYFLAKLSYPVAFVVNESNVSEGEEWWLEPDGTGPFKFKGWQEGELILLERNDLYYRDKAIVSHVAFRLRGNPMQMYETGQIDVTYVYTAYLDRVMDETGPLHEELAISPELSISYIEFNATETPFDDARVRRAFYQAIDKDEIISRVLKDSVTPAEGILPPKLPGYNEEVQGLGYDLDNARALITEWESENATEFPSVTFTIPGEGGYIPSILEAIMYQWQQDLGVEIEVRQLDSSAYIYRLEEEKDNIFHFGWVADYPDPQNLLEVLFHSQSKNNIGGYSNEELDDLLEQAAIEQDEGARFALYQEAEQLIIDEAACVPLWFGKNYILVKLYVQGYTLSTQGIPMLSNVSVESRN